MVSAVLSATSSDWSHWFNRLQNHLKWYALRKIVSVALLRPMISSSCLVSTSKLSRALAESIFGWENFQGKRWEMGSDQRGGEHGLEKTVDKSLDIWLTLKAEARTGPQTQRAPIRPASLSQACPVMSTVSKTSKSWCQPGPSGGKTPEVGLVVF